MIYILIVLILVILDRLFYHPTSDILNVYFGVPGSGKTTFAVYLAKQCQKQSKIITWAKKNPEKKFQKFILNTKYFYRKIPVYSNVPITGTYELDTKKDIGYVMIENAKIIIDEAGIEYNNRNYKTLSQEAIYYFKYHRHYHTSIDVFSQSYDDMDITLRRLAQNFFVVRKSLFPYCISVKRIKRKIGIDENTHQIADLYSFGIPILESKLVFCPPLWKLFNSYSRKQLPEKEWNVY